MAAPPPTFESAIAQHTPAHAMPYPAVLRGHEASSLIAPPAPARPAAPARSSTEAASAAPTTAAAAAAGTSFSTALHAAPTAPAASSMEVQVLDLDLDLSDETCDPPPPMAPQPVVGAHITNESEPPPHIPRKRPRSPVVPEVIDLDDDELLQELERAVPLRAAVSKHPAPSRLRVAGAAVVAHPDEVNKLQVSRGGGLFRVDESGTVDIVDSDDELQLREKDLILNGTNGMTLQAPTQVQNEAVMASVAMQNAAVLQTPLRASGSATGAVVSNGFLANASVGNGLPLSTQAYTGIKQQVASHVPVSTASQQLLHNGAPVQATTQEGTISSAQDALAYLNAAAVHAAYSGSLGGAGGHIAYAVPEVPTAQNPAVMSLGHQNSLADLGYSTRVPVTGVADAAEPIFPKPEQTFGFAGGGVDQQPGLSDAKDFNLAKDTMGTPQYRDMKEESLSRQELTRINKQHELTADATEEAESPEELTVELMPHQRRALAWMIKRETAVHQDDDIVAVDEQCLGGILADDQGLGKTLSMIALLVKKPLSENAAISDNDSDETEEESSSGRSDSDFIDDSSDAPSEVPDRPSWRTLVVCPVSVLNQWKEELSTRVKKKHGPSVYIYHGQKRVRTAKQLKKYDVVITTYAVLANEYPKILKDHHEYKMRKEEKLELPKRTAGPVFDLCWHRVVLDEAQFVKNRGTESWSAVMSLRAEKRWCLTGTPIQNTVDDLYSLFCFIRYRFVPNYEMWNLKWKKRLESASNSVRERAFKQFQTITGIVLLRRTKTEKISGKPLIALPSRTLEVFECGFAIQGELSFYESVKASSNEKVKKHAAEGTLSSNYSSVLLALLRMRQAACHPFLIEYSKMHRSKFAGMQMDAEYTSPYGQETLEEALELIAGGHSVLDMISDEQTRQRYREALTPLPKGQVAHPAFLCSFCRDACLWVDGSALSCGEMFCKACRARVQQKLGCLRCDVSIAGVDEEEAFICADDIRKEVHALVMLGKSNAAVPISEFKRLLQGELSARMYAEKRCKKRRIRRVVIESDEDTSQEGEQKSLPRNTGAREILSPELLELDNSDPLRKLFAAFSMNSTKIQRIVQELQATRDRGLGEKTLIFSQWTSFLDIISFHVQSQGFEICRLDGTMTASQRQRELKEFRANAEKEVFLISTSAGGTGLNLTVSNRVILADVWWNPAVEEQAIDRVHRIGQCRPVHVSRFKMRTTVEEKIYDICKKKKEMTNGTLGVVGQRNLGRTKMSMNEMLSLFDLGPSPSATMPVASAGPVEFAWTGGG